MGQLKLKPAPAQPFIEPFEDDGLRPPANKEQFARRQAIANTFLVRNPHRLAADTREAEVVGI